MSILNHIPCHVPDTYNIYNMFLGYDAYTPEYIINFANEGDDVKETVFGTW